MSNRREALTKIGTIATLALSTNMMAQTGKKPTQNSTKLKGNINHSVCRWCYGAISLEDLCIAAKKIGIKSIELVGPEEWHTLKKHGLTSALPWCNDVGLDKGFNDLNNHEGLIKKYTETIPLAAAEGYKTLICFSGNRNGVSDAQGLENCAIGIKKLLPLCEKHNITLIMELLNSKVDHKDYQCDHTAWGVELCKKIDSTYFKLLYDIYHMQIMEGDIIRTIKENIKYIGHFHTGGNPGRNEIDDSQELYYPAIMKAIVETGYKGFVSQEFIPKSKNPLESLKKCIQICDV